jgi:hypothetical protein
MTTKKDGYPETIHQSLVALRGVLSNPEKKSINPHFKSKYAKLEDIIHHVRGPMSEHGMTFVQNIVNEEASIMAQTILIHASGETMSLDGPAVRIDKFTAQGTGSAATYAKRYGLCSALGIESDEDDDGNAAEDTFKGKNTKAPPKPKPKPKAEAPVEAKTEAPADIPENTIPDEEHADNVLQVLCNTADDFAGKTEGELIDFWKSNKKTIDLLDQGYPEHFKQLKAHFSALRASMKEDHDE